MFCALCEYYVHAITLYIFVYSNIVVVNTSFVTRVVRKCFEFLQPFTCVDSICTLPTTWEEQVEQAVEKDKEFKQKVFSCML